MNDCWVPVSTVSSYAVFSDIKTAKFSLLDAEIVHTKIVSNIYVKLMVSNSMGYQDLAWESVLAVILKSISEQVLGKQETLQCQEAFFFFDFCQV